MRKQNRLIFGTRKENREKKMGRSEWCGEWRKFQSVPINQSTKKTEKKKKDGKCERKRGEKETDTTHTARISSSKQQKQEQMK